MTEPIAVLLEKGATGAFLVIVLYAALRFYTDRNSESAARIADAQRNLEIVTKLQREVLEAVDKLTDLMAAIQQERREERERSGKWHPR